MGIALHSCFVNVDVDVDVPQGGKLHLMIHYIVIGGAGFVCAFQAVRPNGRHMTENKRDRELFNRYNIGNSKKNGIKRISNCRAV